MYWPLVTADISNYFFVCTDFLISKRYFTEYETCEFGGYQNTSTLFLLGKWNLSICVGRFYTTTKHLSARSVVWQETNTADRAPYM